MLKMINYFFFLNKKKSSLPNQSMKFNIADLHCIGTIYICSEINEFGQFKTFKNFVWFQCGILINITKFCTL